MKRFVLILIFLLLAVGAGFYFIRDPGTADIALLGWELQTSALGLLALIIVGFIALAIIWRIISTTLKLPTLWRHRSARQKRQAADEQLLRAWAELERGRFAVAEKLARTHLNDASLPPINYAVAADAHLAQGDTAAALNLLDEVRGAFPRFADFLALHIANRLRQQNKRAAALELLQSLAADHPKDEAILCAQAQTLYELADWQSLHTLLPSLRRLKWPGLTEQDIQRYDRAVHSGLIQNAARQGEVAQLAALWNDTPKHLRQDEHMLASLANAWLTLGQPDQAERTLETALDQKCTPALLLQWLSLPLADPARARTQFTRWSNLASCPLDNALRAFAQAKLAWLNEDTEGAKQALASVLNDHPDVACLKLAAQIAEHERDSAQAVAYYTEAFKRIDG